MRGKHKTDIEIIMEQALIDNNIEYCYDFSIRSKYGYRLDFALPKHKIAVECDGEAWHKEGNLHDKRRDGFFKSIGWKTIRFGGNQILNNINGCIDKIKEEIKNETNRSSC